MRWPCDDLKKNIIVVLTYAVWERRPMDMWVVGGSRKLTYLYYKYGPATIPQELC